MHLLNLFYLFMTSLFAALGMVPLLRKWALSTGTVDIPDGRKVHMEAIPRIGGIAICMGFLFAILAFLDFDARIRGLLAGVLIVFITGVIDDLHGLSPRCKFLGQVLACLVTMTVGRLYLHHLGDLFGTGDIILPTWVGVPFTIFAIVGVVNAINFIDGLDGLAGGVSVIALCAFFALGLLDGNIAVAAVSAALLGSLLGFLKYNFYPARIFMGDTGSMTIGFLLGFLAVLLTQTEGNQVSPVIPVLILGLPLLDTLWVMGRRILQGQNPFAPDRSHVHHQFLDLGLQHRFTVIVIYGISLFWACFSVFFFRQTEYLLLLIFLGVSSLSYLLLRWISRNRHRLSVLRKDSAAGLRESATYRRISELLDRLTPGLLAVTLLFLLTAILWGSRTATGLWPIGIILFAAGAGMVIMTREPQNDFLMVMLYLGGLFITFVQTENGARDCLPGLDLCGLSDLMLWCMGAVIGMRFLFRRPGEFVLSTVDCLILGISVFLAVYLPGIDREGIFLTALPKAVVLYLALRLIAASGRGRATVMVGSMLTVLVVIAGRSWAG